jgi:hypothetical protein
MKHTTALEEKITDGVSYLDCFKGTDRRRTEVRTEDKVALEFHGSNSPPPCLRSSAPSG